MYLISWFGVPIELLVAKHIISTLNLLFFFLQGIGMDSCFLKIVLGWVALL
jgi:hypothetical protein